MSAPEKRTASAPRRAGAAGLVYFVLVFGVGFAFGTIRVLVMAPRFGERTAELLEAPLMLVVSVVAARWIVEWFALSTAGARLAAGVLALALLVAAELGVMAFVSRITLAEYVARRDPVGLAVYLVLLLLFALMPLLAKRRA